MTTPQPATTCHCSACGVGVAGDADTRRWDYNEMVCGDCWRWLSAERKAEHNGNG